MELFILVLFAFLAALFVIAKWREARARKLQAGVWVLRTTLAPSTLHKLIVKGLKGPDAAAAVRRAGNEFMREVQRDSVKGETSAATIAVRLDATQTGVTEVVCEIRDWQGPRKYGVSDVTVVLDCAKRIRALIAEIRREDPAAELLEEPGTTTSVREDA